MHWIEEQETFDGRLIFLVIGLTDDAETVEGQFRCYEDALDFINWLIERDAEGIL